MLSASETDRTTVEARLRAEVEQLLEDNLQLKRHKLEEASTCDGVVKLIKRYDRDRHATLEELNAGLAGIISRRKKLRRESHIRDDWEAEVVALQAQVHADGPRYKRLRNIKQKIAADLERDKQQVKLRQAPVDETTAPRPPHSVRVTPLELKFWENGKVDAIAAITRWEKSTGRTICLRARVTPSKTMGTRCPHYARKTACNRYSCTKHSK